LCDLSKPSVPAESRTGNVAPFDSAHLLGRLDALDITHRTLSHAPVFTVDEARTLRGDLPGAHSKNLFLRDKKGSMWLLCCLADTKIDLRQTATVLGARSLSFASRERLWRILGVTPGAVTPFAVINDREAAVRVVLDRRLLSYDLLNFHPLDNAQTTSLAPDDLLRFLRSEDHDPELIDF